MAFIGAERIRNPYKNVQDGNQLDEKPIARI